MPRTLSKKDIALVRACATACRRSILEMTANASSGHPGGSLSCIDYLSLLYTQIIANTGERVVVSNGHIAPALYAVLAELGLVDKATLLRTFRKAGSAFEGHVARLVRGVEYGTGPLGCGVSAATGFALAEKLNNTKKRVYALVGDGESQEGQVYEMMNFAAKYQLDNLIVFMDYNRVQLSDSLENIMPIHPRKQWESAGWEVLEIDGHDYVALWKALQRAQIGRGKPVLFLAHTIMGKGVDFMEREGRMHRSTWHGKASSKEEAAAAMESLPVPKEDEIRLKALAKKKTWNPPHPSFPSIGSPHRTVKTGTPRLYGAEEYTDCRTAYGQALLDLAKRNKHIVALTADLADSVKTNLVRDAFPARHIECGIAEQHMLSCAGGLSLAGYIPFASTFGAFMTSRAKDQARVNDINGTNVKMVATHCGISVGEDGPTHQAIDDMGSMLGLFNTMVVEPADPNQCDRMVRWLAGVWGNVYMRMGRHKLPVLTKENGKPFFDEKYVYRYGRCDLLRRGTDITIAASGGTAIEALRAHEQLKQKGISAEVILMTSPKQFDVTLFRSIQKTKRVLTVEDHNTRSGYGSQLACTLQKKNVDAQLTVLGVDTYQRSGTAEALYRAAGISAVGIVRAVQRVMPL